jgi:DNA-binding NtrC family response regulator
MNPHEFVKRGALDIVVNLSGPNMDFHRFHFEDEAYTSHILLWWGKAGGDYAKAFTDEMGKRFPKHSFKMVSLNISNPTDMLEVQGVIRSKVGKLVPVDGSSDFFLGPGFLLLQFSLLLLFHNRHKNTSNFRVVQNIRAAFTKERKPRLDTLLPSSSLLGIGLDFLGTSSGGSEICLIPTVKTLHKKAKKIALAHQYPVLVLGESGSGKEHLARLIHDNSPRRNKPFKPVNLGAFSYMGDSNLLRSELFGHEKGAFTGAEKQKKGLFEECDEGTLFFDEIGDISLDVQVSLLRVLQDGSFMRVGGSKELTADVRIIAATNKNLNQACKEGTFRDDLYHRINIGKLTTVPWRKLPISERKEFLLWEMQRTIQEFKEGMGLDMNINLSKGATQLLSEQSFEGNFRQVSSLVKRLLIDRLGETLNKEIDEEEVQLLLYEEFGFTSPSSADFDTSLTLDEVKHAHVLRVLVLKNGNKAQAAKTLGISVNTLKATLDKEES